MDAHESMRFAKIEDYLPNGPVTLRLISQAFLLESPQTEAVETESDLTPRQQQALDLVRETKGLYQIDLWKELDVSSRTGTWIATVLEEKRMIERESAVHNGHSTYLLIPRK